MSGWRDSVELVSCSQVARPDGSFSEKRSSRRVCCNRRRVGAATWAAATAAGLKAEAEVEVRSCDYAGEQVAVVGGVEHEVERVRDGGEFCVLTLRRRLPDG